MDLGKSGPWLFLEAVEVSWQILQVQLCPILAFRRVSAQSSVAMLHSLNSSPLSRVGHLLLQRSSLQKKQNLQSTDSGSGPNAMVGQLS